MQYLSGIANIHAISSATTRAIEPLAPFNFRGKAIIKYSFPGVNLSRLVRSSIKAISVARRAL